MSPAPWDEHPGWVPPSPADVPEPIIRMSMTTGRPAPADWSDDQWARWLAYRRRATQRDLEFTLTPDQFLVMLGQPCYLCGGPGGGVDRVDSTQGYTQTNSRPCCGVCNVMKHRAALPDFLERCAKIADMHRKCAGP